jgi:tetratricopeptide (TPR) repeat protein
MKRISLAFVAMFLACAAAASDQPGPPLPPTEQENLYLDAERAYLRSEPAEALQVLSRFFAVQGPQSPRVRIRGHNLRGLIFFQSRNLQGAVQDFEAAVQLANRSLEQSDSLLHLTRYNLGNALFQVNRAQDALDVLSSVNEDALDQDTRMRFHHLFGNVLSSRDRPLDALVHYLKASDQARDVAARDTFLQKALGASRGLYVRDPKGDLEKISALRLSPETPAGVAVQVLLARGHMYAGEPAMAEGYLLSALQHASPTHPLRPQAEEMLRISVASLRSAPVLWECYCPYQAGLPGLGASA